MPPSPLSDNGLPSVGRDKMCRRVGVDKLPDTRPAPALGPKKGAAEAMRDEISANLIRAASLKVAEKETWAAPPDRARTPGFSRTAVPRAGWTAKDASSLPDLYAYAKGSPIGANPGVNISNNNNDGLQLKDYFQEEAPLDFFQGKAIAGGRAPHAITSATGPQCESLAHSRGSEPDSTAPLHELYIFR